MKVHIVLRTASQCALDPKPRIHKVFYERKDANKEAQIKNARAYANSRKIHYWVSSKEIE